MSYTVIITEESAANVSVTDTSYPITIEYNATNIDAGTYGNANVANFLANYGSNTVSTTGNVTAGYLLGNGSQITGLPAGYANANAVAFGEAGWSGNIVPSANAVYSLGNVSRQWRDLYVSNTSVYIGNVPLSVTSGNTLTIGGQPLLSNNSSVSVSTTGNVSAAYFIGDGSQLTNLPLGGYSNSNVSAFLAAFGSNSISTTGNVTAGTFAGNGSALTSLPAANITGTVANATYALNANAATYATTAVQANVANVANSVSGSNVSGAVANATYALNANAASYATDAVQANVANVANSVAGANVTGTVANATYALNSNAATFAGTVTTNAQPNITSVGNLTSLTVTGDAAIGGNLQVTGNVTYIASNVVTINDKFINVANNAATSSAANGGGIGVGPVGSEYATWAFSDANTAWQSNIKIEAPSVSVSGNVTGSNVVGTWLWGDGSNITGVVAGAASTRIEVKNTSGGTIVKGTPVYATGVVGASTIVEIAASRADTPSTLPCLGLLAQDLLNNGQGYAVTVGTLTTVNTNGYTTGQELYVAATGGLTASRPTGANTVQTVGIVGRVNSVTGSIEVNVWNVNSLPNLGNGNVWVGNATGFPTQQGQYGDANVAAYLPTYTGNLAGGNLNVTGVVSGNGSGLTTLTGANVTGTVANATYALNANAASFATSAEQANVANVANSVSGSNVSGTVALAQYVTQNAQANITSVGTLSSLSVSGNVTVSGTTQLSNVQISNASQIVSNVAWTPDTASFGQAGRIIIGNGINGSTGNAATNTNLPVWSSGRLMVSDSWNRSNTAHGTAVETVSAAVTMTGNATQNAFRAQALNATIVVGGGAAGNTINLGQTPGRPFGISAGQFNVNVGDPNGNTGVGNTTVGHLVTNGGVVQTWGNSQVGNMMGYYTLAIQNTASANINNIVGYALGGAAGAGVPVISGNVYSFYHPSANSNQSMGAGISGYMRAAPNYYAFRNDDNVAQAKLGSLRFYHEYTHPLATSGTVNIDKDNAQVQSLEPTGNVTIGDFQNFVTSANDSVNNDLQTDTVKLIIRQGATPYSVILPTGNTKIQYVGNVSTIPVSANTTSIVTIQASGNAALGDNYVVRVDSTEQNSTVSVTGNINGANLVASANLTSTQQTIVGSANTGTTGNIVISGKNIATDMAWQPDAGNAVTGPNGRVVVGTGWNGNINHTAVQSRLGLFDSVTRTNTTTAVRPLDVDTQVSLTGNVTSSSFRQQGMGARVRIGGGPGGNTINVSSPAAGSVGTVAALQPNIDVGNASPYLLGNTSVSHALLNGGFITTHSGGLVGNAYGMVPGTNAGTGAGNITNYVGFASQLGSSPNITGNLYAFYHGNLTSSAATGVGINASARPATNYYAFRNDDDVAQSKLGSLRFYHEYQHSVATSGTVNIDKNNAQVQLLEPTGNVTIGDFQNFVFTASDGVNNDLQTDTVKLIVRQGATPYSVILPTGNSKIQYVGNVSTVPATANSTSIVTIQASGNAALADSYLVRVDSTVPNSTVSVTGNITGNYFIGNGSQLTGITASLSGNMVGNIAGQGYTISNLGHVAIANSGNIAIGTVTITNNNVSPGTLAVSAQLEGTAFSASGNVTGNNIVATSFIRTASYTVANLTAITGAVGMMAAVSDQGGKFAYWDTTNTRWSYVHDNSAV